MYDMRFACWMSAVLCMQRFTGVFLQAPEDADSFCSELNSVILPSYPVNSRVLMDSYNYINLLPQLPGGSSTWQEVDIDGILGNLGGPTEWQQVTSKACSQTLASCHTNFPAQNNWLITQHISRVVNGTLLPQVSAMINFELARCSNGSQRSFILKIWETSSISKLEARNTSNYQDIQRVSPNENSVGVVQEVIQIDFATHETGFYMALVDDNACIALTRLVVLYYVCPPLLRELVLYPETLAPPINNLPHPVAVMGQCAEGAYHLASPTIQCFQKGKWNLMIESAACQCSPGYVENMERSLCSECPAGEYASNGTHCMACPNNTKLEQSAVTQCQCLEGYRRINEGFAYESCMQATPSSSNDKVPSWKSSILVVMYAALSILIVALIITMLSVFSTIFIKKWKKRKKNSGLFDEVDNANYAECNSSGIVEEVDDCIYDEPDAIRTNIQVESNPSYGISLQTRKE